MKTVDFFNELEDPIKKKETIDKLIKYYVETKEDNSRYYSHYMYEKIISTLSEKKVIGVYNTQDALDLELHCFNEWKNSILNFDVENIKPEYKSGFIKLSKKLKGFSPKTVVDMYEFKYGSSTKKGILEGDKDLKEIFKSLDYNRVNDGKSWKFFASKYIYMGSGHSYDVHHRFYVNTDSTETHYFSKLLIEKCEAKKMNYYFKIDEDGNRADTVVIYCSDENLLEFLDILKEIKNEHPELNDHLHKPPFLTSNIDDWIGYGSEPSIRVDDKPCSYTSLRTKIIEESITKLNKDFIKKNKANTIKVKGKKMEFVDYIAEIVFQDAFNELKDNAKYIKYYKTEEKFAETYGFKPSQLNDSKFINIYKDYVKSQIRKIINKIDTYDESDIMEFYGNNETKLKLKKTLIETALRKVIHIARTNTKDFDDRLREEIYARGEKYNLDKKNIAFDKKFVHSTISKERGCTLFIRTIMNSQNAIIIEKDPTTKRVDKYIYDSKTGEKIHEYTLAQDKYNMYQPGTYINFVEFTTNFLTEIYEKAENIESVTFAKEENEKLDALELMEKAYAFCCQDGGMSIGDEYTKLIREKGKTTKYADLERLYDCSTKAYNKGKTKLEKGLYMNKEKIEDFFKNIKLNIILKETQNKTTAKQMKK